ncbi:MAG: hypothetical protein ACYC6N_27585 [Pirellulaceae bacterium]
MNPLDMLSNHPFWGGLTLAVLVWYSCVTVYVAIRGAADIKHMLGNLAERQRNTEPSHHGK